MSNENRMLGSSLLTKSQDPQVDLVDTLVRSRNQFRQAH